MLQGRPCGIAARLTASKGPTFYFAALGRQAAAYFRTAAFRSPIAVDSKSLHSCARLSASPASEVVWSGSESEISDLWPESDGSESDAVSSAAGAGPSKKRKGKVQERSTAGDPPDPEWLAMFEQLVAYKELFGDGLVPRCAHDSS